MPVIRQRCPSAQVGIILNFTPAYPATDSSADQSLTRGEHTRFNLWFLDPIAGRGYPQNAWDSYGNDVTKVEPEDMKIISASLDFLGVNYYSRQVCHDPAGGEGGRVLNERSKVNVSDRDWEIYPQAMYDLLIWLGMGYNFPNIYLTENGASYRDVLSPDGEVHDPKRTDFLYQHLTTLLKVIEAGVPVRGYFCWSLMDNFEWAFGTSSRFGLTFTDFTTQKRILKDSGKWFGKVARANRIVELEK